MPATTYGWPTSAGASSSICAVAATGPPWSMTSSLGASRALTASASGSTSRSRSPNGSCAGTPVAPSTTSGAWRRVKASDGWRTARLRSGADPGTGGPICPSICAGANGTPRWPASGAKSTFQIGGAGSVGTGSLRGMPHLRRLRQAGFSIWPFHSASPWTVMEIYPRLLTGPVHKSSHEHRARYLGDSALAGCPDLRRPHGPFRGCLRRRHLGAGDGSPPQRTGAPRTDVRPRRPARGRRLATLLLTSPE